MVLMVLTSDLEIRQRDVNAALEGSVDLVILVEIVAYLAAGALFVLGGAAPRGRSVPRPMGAVWALVAVLATSALWAPSPALAIVRGGQVVIVAGIAMALARRAGERDFAFIAHIYVLMVTGFIALGLVWRVAPSGQVAGRYNWAATHPVVAASLLLVSVMSLLAWTRADSGPRFMKPVVVWSLLFVHTGALLATQTRGAILAGVVGLMVWIMLALSRRRDIAIIAICLSPVAVAAGQSVFQSFILRGESVEQLQTLNSRTDLWTEAISLVEGHLWFGRGYFSARELFLESIGLGGAHNAYIEVLVSAGLVGVAALTLVLWKVIGGLRSMGRHPQRPLIAAVLAATLTHGLTAQYWAQGGTGANVWLFLVFGWVAAILRRQSREDDPALSTPG